MYLLNSWMWMMKMHWYFAIDSCFTFIVCIAMQWNGVLLGESMPHTHYISYVHTYYFWSPDFKDRRYMTVVLQSFALNITCTEWKCIDLSCNWNYGDLRTAVYACTCIEIGSKHTYYSYILAIYRKKTLQKYKLPWWIQCNVGSYKYKIWLWICECTLCTDTEYVN